jgi:hypothetical protein
MLSLWYVQHLRPFGGRGVGDTGGGEEAGQSYTHSASTTPPSHIATGQLTVGVYSQLSLWAFGNLTFPYLFFLFLLATRRVLCVISLIAVFLHWRVSMLYFYWNPYWFLEEIFFVHSCTFLQS